MCIQRETREKARQSLAFSPVSKPHTHITYMLRQCTSIVYKEVTIVLEVQQAENQRICTLLHALVFLYFICIDLPLCFIVSRLNILFYVHLN